MRLSVSQLRALIMRDVSRIIEAEEKGGEGEKPKGEPWWTDFYCKKHLLPLKPIFSKRDETILPATPTEDLQPYGPLRPGVGSRNIVPPTSTRPDLTTQVTLPKKMMVKLLVCPLSSEPGPYAITENNPEGRACDYVVTARKVGKRNAFVALGEVAAEMNVAYNPDLQGPLAPRHHRKGEPTEAELEKIAKGEIVSRRGNIPKSLDDVIDRIEAQKRKAREEAGQPPPSKDNPITFSNKELLFLTRDYRNKLITAKREAEKAGAPYKGPEPYWNKGDEIFRELLRRGWEMAEPEKERQVRPALPSMPEKQEVSAPTGEEEPWYDDDELAADDEHDTDDIEDDDLPSDDDFKIG